MMDDPIQIPEIGLAYVGKYSYNNRFIIGWGAEGISAFYKKKYKESECNVYHLDNLINLEFDGEWKITYQVRTKPFGDDSSLVNADLSDNLKSTIVDAILKITEVRVSLEKWRKSALKRLRVSVPRLKEEYEASKKRMELLDSVRF